MKPEIHAEDDRKKYGGKMTDYLMIHQMMDSSKAAYPNNAHRIVFHHIFGSFIMEQMFGIDYDGLKELQSKHGLSDAIIEDIVNWKDKCTRDGKSRVNSDGKKFSVRDIAENHCISDFRGRFLPSLQDYMEHFEMPGWVNNAMGVPNRLKRKEFNGITGEDKGVRAEEKSID